MTDGDYYKTYAKTRKGLGSPSTTLLPDDELEEMLYDADGIIHDYMNRTAKITSGVGLRTCSKIETDLVWKFLLRARYSKESNLPSFSEAFFKISPELDKNQRDLLDLVIQRLNPPEDSDTQDDGDL